MVIVLLCRLLLLWIHFLTLLSDAFFSPVFMILVLFPIFLLLLILMIAPHGSRSQELFFPFFSLECQVEHWSKRISIVALSGNDIGLFHTSALVLPTCTLAELRRIAMVFRVGFGLILVNV